VIEFALPWAAALLPLPLLVYALLARCRKSRGYSNPAGSLLLQFRSAGTWIN